MLKIVYVMTGQRYVGPVEVIIIKFSNSKEQIPSKYMFVVSLSYTT